MEEGISGLRGVGAGLAHTMYLKNMGIVVVAVLRAVRFSFHTQLIIPSFHTSPHDKAAV